MPLNWDALKVFRLNSVFHSKGTVFMKYSLSFRLLFHCDETKRDVVRCLKCKKVHH